MKHLMVVMLLAGSTTLGAQMFNANVRTLSLQKLNMADLQARNGNDQEAMNLYNDVVLTDPTCSEAYMKRARLHAIMNHTQAAWADFNRGIQLNPLSVIYYDRVMKLQFLKVDNDCRVNDHADAYHICRDSVFSNPTNAGAHNAVGTLNVLFGQYLDALEDFNNAIRLQPDYAQAYHNRALTRLLLLQTDYACEDFRTAFALGDKESENFLITFCHSVGF